MKSTIIKSLAGIALCLCTFSGCASKSGIEHYMDFLTKEKHASAKDYILSLFKDNDMVILCERNHMEMTQYDLFLDVMKDPYFIENVGTVFTEVGVQILNPELNAFLQNDTLSEAEIDKQTMYFQRNCEFSIWEKSNFSYFLKGIHNINKGIPTGKKIEMHPSDMLFIEGDATKEKISALAKNTLKRDELMAEFIIGKFDGMKKANPKKKTLVIMNYRHAFNFLPYSMPWGIKINNAGKFLFDHYPGKVANVMINSCNQSYEAYQDGKWDAAFKAAGIENAAFDFKGSPFGDDNFDQAPRRIGHKYKDVFTGYVYYLPLDKFILSTGLPGLIEDGFYERFVEREAMFNQAFYGDILKREVTPVDKEAIKNFNEVKTFKLHNIDKMMEDIDKWLK